MTCALCNDSGVVQALWKEKPFGIFAFNCGCQTAQRKNRRFPDWATADRVKFVTVSEWDKTTKTEQKERKAI